jgi:signal peptidase I
LQIADFDPDLPYLYKLYKLCKLYIPYLSTMKKYFLGFAIALGLLLALAITGRMTGIFQVFRMPSYSMEPSIKMGSRFFVSNLKSPKKYRIIAFRRAITEKEGFAKPGTVHTFCYRLIGKGGDKVEIKDGYAYVNSQMVDDSARIRLQYEATADDGSKIIHALELEPNSPQIYGTSNTLTDKMKFFLSGEEYKIASSIASLKRIKEPMPSSIETALSNVPPGENWTADSYGPVTVPPDHYFVLGDNRYMAMDSRYVGFIHKDGLVGTVIWK